MLKKNSLEEGNLFRQKINVGSGSKRHNLEVLGLLPTNIQSLSTDRALRVKE